RRFNRVIHFGTSANEEVIALGCLLGKDFYFSSQSLLLHRLLNHDRDMIWLERLGDEIVRSLPHGLDGKVYGTVGGNHHDWKIPSSAPDLFKDIEAAEIRHGNV